MGINYSAGSTGGEDKHTLTINELASHNHTGSATTSGSTHTHALTMQASHGESGNGGVPRFSDGDVWSPYKTQNLSAAGEHSHAITINNSGGGQAHNNMQPYLSVYMWKEQVDKNIKIRIFLRGLFFLRLCLYVKIIKSLKKALICCIKLFMFFIQFYFLFFK